MAKKLSIKSQRAALDRVVALVKKEANSDIGPYDIACWILYACDRSDAMMFAKGDAEGIHPGDDDDPRTLTMEEELIEKTDRWRDDSDEAFNLIERQKELGKRFDPGYRKPVMKQRDWL